MVIRNTIYTQYFLGHNLGELKKIKTWKLNGKNGLNYHMQFLILVFNLMYRYVCVNLNNISYMKKRNVKLPYCTVILLLKWQQVPWVIVNGFRCKLICSWKSVHLFSIKHQKLFSKQLFIWPWIIYFALMLGSSTFFKYEVECTFQTKHLHVIFLIFNFQYLKS